MTETLKNRIKRNAEHDKERAAGSVGVNGGLNFLVEPQSATISSVFASVNSHGAGRIDTTPVLVGSGTGLDTAIYQTSSFPDDPAALKHFETAFTTKYLDDLFPFLFPFYRPNILETGRYWILSLLEHSDVARQAALSLTSYFLTVCMQETYPGEFEPCKKEIWGRLSQQTNGYFMRVQEEVEQLRLQAGGATVQDRARSMASIVQALLFEVALGRSGSWNIHLTAALGLFEEISCAQTKHEATPTFMSLLIGFGKPAWYTPEIDSYVWNTEQAGFRFFTALLIFLDVVGSTATEERPRFLDHYPLLLADIDEGEHTHEPISLQLSVYVGCENWIIIAIGEIAALAKWKKDAKSNGSLSVMELARRAMRIEASLDKGILRLETRSSESVNPKQNRSPSWYGRPPPLISSQTASSIWAQAALIYLAVVVSGWQPSNAAIRTGVRRTISLLLPIKSPSHLQAFKWPFVVAGCLAEPGEEQHQFMAILRSNNEMGMYGVMTEARDILLKTWEKRCTFDRDGWEMASCFRILGFPVLLM